MKIKVNGFMMNYALEGPAEAPVVVMSHSLGVSLSLWDQQVLPLAKNYRVLRYDARGHGGSEAPGDAYSMNDLVDDVRALLNALDIKRVHFVGLSMGGMIGQLFALKYPAMLASLVLCDTTSRVTEPNPPVDTWDKRIQDIKAGGIEGIVEPALQRQFTAPYRAAQPAMMDRMRAIIRQTSPLGYMGCIHAIKTVYTTNRLEEIQAPTLVIVGDQDKITPIAAAQKIHDRIKGSELLIIPSASHLSNVEQADLFNEAITTFLGKAFR